MFGKKLRDLRYSHNLTMDDLIELYNKKYDAKMNKSTLSRYENDLQHPLYTVVKNLADFFNVSVDYLMGRTDDAEAKQKIKLTEAESNLLSKYRSLNSSGKQKADDYITDLSEQEKYTAIDSGNMTDDIVKEIQRATALSQKHTNKK